VLLITCLNISKTFIVVVYEKKTPAAVINILSCEELHTPLFFELGKGELTTSYRFLNGYLARIASPSI